MPLLLLVLSVAGALWLGAGGRTPFPAVTRPVGLAAPTPAQERTPPSAVPVADELEPGARMAPGRYEFRFAGPPAVPVARAAVFEGFNTSHAFGISDGDRDGGRMVLTFWTANRIARDPCLAFRDREQLSDPGPGVRDLAVALRDQRHRVGPPPRPVSLGGYRGLYVELRFPAGFEVADCDALSGGGSFDAWWGEAIGWQHRDPHSIERLWILDVRGQRLVVGALCDARLPPERVAVLERTLRSVTFH